MKYSSRNTFLDCSTFSMKSSASLVLQVLSLRRFFTSWIRFSLSLFSSWILNQDYCVLLIDVKVFLFVFKNIIVYDSSFLHVGQLAGHSVMMSSVVMPKRAGSYTSMLISEHLFLLKANLCLVFFCSSFWLSLNVTASSYSYIII